MCVTDRHDMTLAVKVELNPNTTNQISLEESIRSVTWESIKSGTSMSQGLPCTTEPRWIPILYSNERITS